MQIVMEILGVGVFLALLALGIRWTLKNVKIKTEEDK